MLFGPCGRAGADLTRWRKGCCCKELPEADYKATGMCLFGPSQVLQMVFAKDGGGGYPSNRVTQKGSA